MRRDWNPTRLLPTKVGHSHSYVLESKPDIVSSTIASTIRHPKQVECE